jgi:hypothetical protein
MRLATWSVCCLSAFALLALEQTAKACSPDFFVHRGVFPPSETAGVPTNTEIRLSYSNGRTIGDPSVLVRPVGGQPIALQIRAHDQGHYRPVRLIVAKPAEELLPNTTYEVLDRVVVGCRPNSGADSGVVCLQPDHAVVATFATGATKDATPPSFGGLKAATIGNKIVCENGGCCGPYSAVPVNLSWDPAIDDRSPDLVLYNVYRGDAGTKAVDQPVARYWRYVGLHGELLCSGSPDQNTGLPGSEIIEPGAYTVRAVDSAGNEDSNTAVVEISPPCGTAEPDGETEASGCTISRAGSSRDVSGFALLGGLLLVGSARRPRRSLRHER